MNCFDICKRQPCQDNLCINKKKVERSNFWSNPESVGWQRSNTNRSPSPANLHLIQSFCLPFPAPHRLLFASISGLIALISFTCNPARIPWNNRQDHLYLKLTLHLWGLFKVIIQSVILERLKEDRGNTAARSWLEAGKLCGNSALK